jgi:hypothetical protein
MGLKTLDFYLFEKDLEGTAFRSGYAIAIEYLEGAQQIKSLAPIHGTVPDNKKA